MKRTTTERFDAEGKLTERVVVEISDEDFTDGPNTITITPYIGDPPGGWFPTGNINETDHASRCPCNPANGGSGMCGCVLGGTKITCGSLG